MKITISPSADQSGEKYPHSTVSIEIQQDDLSLPYVIENLIRPALVAWGFHAENVSEQLNVES